MRWRGYGPASLRSSVSLTKAQLKMPTLVEQKLAAELSDLKSQRNYFIRRLERATDLNRSQRRFDLATLDRRIASHQRTLTRITN